MTRRPSEPRLTSRESTTCELVRTTQLVDLVKEDEFPLSLFYVPLKPKIEDAAPRRRDDAVASGVS